MAQKNEIMKQQLKRAIADRADRQALGNTGQSLANVASDICHELKDKTSMRHLVEATFLSRTTIDRLMDMSESKTGRPYRPNADTVERVFVAAGYGIAFEPVAIKPKFANKPKDL